MLLINKIAQGILSKVYWDANGWKRPPETPSADDFAIASTAGYMFENIVFGHDELIQKIRDLADQITVAEASDAFVASLSTRWLFLRPFLPSLIIARSLPQHTFEPTGRSAQPGATGPCAVCNVWCKPEISIDRNVLNFERHKWGGVRHLNLDFVWFCLDRLRIEGSAGPTNQDLELLRSVISVLGSAPTATSMTQAEPLLKLLKSSKYERYVILETLSIVGVLQNPDHPGFLDRFPRTIDRQLPDRRFVDRGYPAEWWTGANGINGKAIAEVFPQLNGSTA